MVFIFDMDGVLVDNQNWHFLSWIEFGKRHNLEITKEEFSKHFGSTNHLIMNSLFKNKITEEEIITFGEEKESIYRELYNPYIEPLEGLPAFLELIQGRGFKIALATSAPTLNVKFTLEETGLAEYFSTITDSSMVRFGKPDPQIYLLTADKLGVKPSECIVFEDSVPGILSGQNAGMNVIGVATTHKPDELLSYVNEIIMNFEAAEDILKKANELSNKER
jgi:beta-phosphoglucomutase